jgi:5-methylcytosine-specific restriction endonuclease McrA
MTPVIDTKLSRKGGQMGRKRGTDQRGRHFSDDTVQKVWKRGSIVRGKNPDSYRRDAAGNVIYRPSYGKDSEMGWEVDHRKPVDKGGRDNLGNLQPLQTDENRQKGKRYPWRP